MSECSTETLSETYVFDGLPPVVGLDWYDYDESLKLVARPGCGKTTQSFLRLMLNVQESDLRLSDTCVVTYRREMAKELIKSAKQFSLTDDDVSVFELAETILSMWGTVHAIARRLAGSKLSNIVDGDSNDVGVNHEAEFCDEHNIPYYEDTPHEKTEGRLLFEIFSWLIDNRVSPRKAHLAPQYRDLQEVWQGQPDIQRLWEEWSEYKTRKECWDFGEILVYALVEKLVPDCELLIIDEYHDAFPLMRDVLVMWIDAVRERGGTVIVTGDPLQVVNEYQGADASYFEELDLPELYLPETHRVPESHWRLAGDIISESYKRPAVSSAVEGGQLEWRHTPRWESSDSVPPGEGTPDDLYEEFRPTGKDETMMFLVRTKSQARAVALALRDAGILFGGSTGSEAWMLGEAEQRVALYNALQKLRRYNSEDFEPHDWREEYVYTGPRREPLTATEIEYIVKHVPSQYIDGGPKSDAMNLARSWKHSEIDTDVESLSHLVSRDFFEVFTEPLDALDSLVSVSAELKSWLQPALKRNDDPIDPENHSLVIRTAHAAKGSEAECVILYDGVTKNISRSVQGADRTKRDAENRVWYVATTRSRETLVIIHNAFSWTRPYLGKRFTTQGDNP